jgi:superfamily I DNA/RNA helicase
VKALSDYVPEDFSPQAAILCRNTAPLVSFAFSLIRRNVGCRVLGREIGQGLIQIIKKLEAKDLNDLSNRLALYQSREVARFERRGEEASADAVRDRCLCIDLFISVSDSITNLIQRITLLFDDSTKGILTLATIHKSKGLEWPMVFLLDWDLCPSKFAKLEWQKVQERNLQYVAVTRAKLDLRFIKSNSWRKDKDSRSRLEILAELD